MTSAIRASLLLCLCLLYAVCASAQLDLSAGPQLTYPFIITRSGRTLNSGHLGAGLRLGADYAFNRQQFFPSLRLSFGENRLPLQLSGINEGALSFSVSSAMLNGCYLLTIRDRRIAFYSGVGVYRIKLRKVVPSGTDNSIVSIDSTANISTIFPAANAGVEYRGRSEGKKFYVTAGISLNYIKLPDGANTYSLHVMQDNKVVSSAASFEGHLLVPTLYLVLSYKIRKPGDGFYEED